MNTLTINGVVITMGDDHQLFYRVPEDMNGKQFKAFKDANMERINQYFNRTL